MVSFVVTFKRKNVVFVLFIRTIIMTIAKINSKIFDKVGQVTPFFMNI